MKKLGFAFSAVILSCFITCTNDAAHKDGPSEKAKKNMENLKGMISMLEAGDYSKAGDYIATDEIQGLNNWKAMFVQMRASVSNVKNEIKKEFSDDDYSMVWARQTWTQKTDDPIMGMKAGQNGDIQTIEICKHGADGKIIDHWNFMYMDDVMKMMHKMPTDTSVTK